MDGEAELRRNWEFAATAKLLTLLSVPLSFSVPDPPQLEEALLDPAQHISLLANLHGRLLGLSTGTSSAKKWLPTAARFIAKRPFEFDHILAGEQDHQTVKNESTQLPMKEEPQEEEETHPSDAQPVQPMGSSPSPAQFPREEADYFRLRPITKLLVLHAIAELVISEHDSLLSAGSVADIALDEMRCYPFASDAVGNDYWYFGDGQRVYREPGRKTFKTRLQLAEEDAIAAEKAAQDAAAEAERRAKEEQLKEAERAKEEARRKREEKKRKSMEKWAPRVAATRTTRASRRAEQSLFTSASTSISQEEGGSSRAAGADSQRSGSENKASRGGRRGRRAVQSEIEAQPAPTPDVGTSPDLTERKGRGRRRKSAVNDEAAQTPSRTRKRPRKSGNFEDPTLRDCEEWQTICVGAESVKEVLLRFQPDMVTVLPSEKVLVRRLEEEILPEMQLKEAKIRKEQERLERKRRNEMLIISTKRSSRVQALEQKREEAARRVAEEEERERELENRKADHAETVKAQVADLERDLAREIRSARRAHGRTEAIDRDDQLQRAYDRKAARASRMEAAVTRRSARSLRNTRLGSTADEDRSLSRGRSVRTSSRRRRFSEAVNDSSTPAQSDVDVPEASGEADYSEDHAASPMDIYEPSEEKSSGVDAPEVRSFASEDVKIETDIRNDVGETDAKHHPNSESNREIRRSEGLYTSGVSEAAIEDPYTWLINPDDGEPIRVLDKFFFALKPSFEDAPLELIDNQDLNVMGFGILVPPFGSDVEAICVEIGKIDEWVIEYGAEPKLWTKSGSAWYELRDPAVEYRTAYASTRRKYEMCIRVSILGATYRTADLTYSAIVDLLGLRYKDMQAFSEAQIVEEKRFIISQMESLGTKGLLQSGFIRELRKRIRQEDERMRKKELVQKDSASVKDDQKSSSGKAPEAASKTGSNAKRRGSATGRQVVPRAVSTIISSVLRAATATKSNPTNRKRKQKPGTVAGTGTSPTGPSKRMKQASSDGDCIYIGRITKSEMPEMGSVGVENGEHLIHVPKDVKHGKIVPDNVHEVSKVADPEVSRLSIDAGHASTADTEYRPPAPLPSNGRVLPKEQMACAPDLNTQSMLAERQSSDLEYIPTRGVENSAADDVVMSDSKAATEKHGAKSPPQGGSSRESGEGSISAQGLLPASSVNGIKNGCIPHGHAPLASDAGAVPNGIAAHEGNKHGG